MICPGKDECKNIRVVFDDIKGWELCRYGQVLSVVFCLVARHIQYQSIISIYGRSLREQIHRELEPEHWNCLSAENKKLFENPLRMLRTMLDDMIGSA